MKLQSNQSDERCDNSDSEVARVALSNGMEALVDASDLYLVQHIKWHARPVQTKIGTVYYAIGICDGRRVNMHRIILNSGPHDIPDHKDRNPLNNRRSNLRPATSAENAWNRFGWGKSGVKGVCWDKANGRYMAYINTHGKRRYLGKFQYLEDAIEARDAATRADHGEFGVTSDIETRPRASDQRLQFLAVREAVKAARRAPLVERNRKIAMLRESGLTFRAISERFDLSPEAIRVICAQKED